jgi:hypothetical protein
MYARVVTVQYQPGKIDEGLQIFLNSIMPAARQQPGYKGRLHWEIVRRARPYLSA